MKYNITFQKNLDHYYKDSPVRKKNLLFFVFLDRFEMFKPCHREAGL